MKVKEKKSKKNLFTILYLFIFIILLFELTMSYFTARTRSENNALDTKAGQLTLALSVAEKYPGYHLLPLNDNDIMKAYHNKCVDDNGNSACAAYDIELLNESAKQEIIGTIDFEINGIENLSYLVLDEKENIYQQITKIPNNAKNMPLGSDFILDSAFELGKPTKRNFTLLIWLSDYEYDQVEDKGGNFSATVAYNSIYGRKLSSNITGLNNGGNQ